MKVSETLFKINEELASVSGQRFKRGLIAQQEALKAGLERDNSNARFQNAQQEFIETKNRISTELGETFEIEQDWPWIKRWNEGVKALLSRPFNLDAVPSYRADSRRYAAAKREKSATLLGYFPSLDLSASHGYFNWETNRDDLDSRLTLTLTVSIFDLGKIGDIRTAGADVKTAYVNQERTARDIKAAYEISKRNFEISLQSARMRESNVKLAESLFADNRRRLKAGRSSINELVVDQDRLADAQILAVSGWRDAHVNFAKYCHSLGFTVNECR